MEKQGMLMPKTLLDKAVLRRHERVVTLFLAAAAFKAAEKAFTESHEGWKDAYRAAYGREPPCIVID